MAGFTKKAGMVSVIALAASLAWAPSALAVEDGVIDALLQRIEEVQAELEALRAEVEENRIATEAAREIAEDANQVAEVASRTATDVYADANESDASWHIAGYGQAGFVTSDGDSPDSFILGSFNPVFHFQYRDLVIFEAELEFEIEDGETKTELEYAQLDFLVHDNATIVIGKFLSPVGQFQERLHPGWINRLADAPAGFGHGGVQPASEVGVQVRGGIPVGDMRANYSIAIGNGPRLGHDGVELEGFADDENDNKALSGRIGFFPIPELEVGASFLTAEMVGPLDHTTDLPMTGDYDLWGADFAYIRGPWRARGEYLNAELTGFGPPSGTGHHTTGIARTSAGSGADEELLDSDAEWEAWYLELAYRLSDLSENRVLQNFEPVARYGEFHVTGTDELSDLSEDRFNIGLNYWFAPSIVLHTAIEWRDFVSDEIDDETLLQFQVSYGF